MQTAYTIDGGVVFHLHCTRQQLADLVGVNLSQPKGPYVAYTINDDQGDAFPYLAWEKTDTEVIGHSCRNFEEAADKLDQIYGR